MGLKPRNLKGFSMLMVVISVLCTSGMYTAGREFPKHVQGPEIKPLT